MAKRQLYRASSEREVGGSPRPYRPKFYYFPISSLDSICFTHPPNFKLTLRILRCLGRPYGDNAGRGRLGDLHPDLVPSFDSNKPFFLKLHSHKRITGRKKFDLCLLPVQILMKNCRLETNFFQKFSFLKENRPNLPMK